MIPSSTCPSWQHDIPAQPDILVALISYTTGGDTIRNGPCLSHTAECHV